MRAFSYSIKKKGLGSESLRARAQRSLVHEQVIRFFNLGQV
jgi:hypothetical protein